MDCHADWLVQFAIMGSAYSKAVLKREKPLVGLLSIGTEDCKGNEMTKETFPLLKEVAGIDFRGYVEPEPVIYARIYNLTKAMADGLKGFNVISDADVESLNSLMEISDTLKNISLLLHS